MIVQDAGDHYEIEELEERPAEGPDRKFEMPNYEELLKEPPPRDIKYPVIFGPLPPPIPTVFHCRCDKWWVLTEHLYGTPLCPLCGSAMSAYMNFRDSDFRYGNYGPASKHEIKRIASMKNYWINEFNHHAPE